VSQYENSKNKENKEHERIKPKLMQRKNSLQTLIKSKRILEGKELNPRKSSLLTTPMLAKPSLHLLPSQKMWETLKYISLQMLRAFWQ